MAFELLRTLRHNRHVGIKRSVLEPAYEALCIRWKIADVIICEAVSKKQELGLLIPTDQVSGNIVELGIAKLRIGDVQSPIHVIVVSADTGDERFLHLQR